jgi:xylulokinase
MTASVAELAVVLGIDIGTTNAKGVACLADGTVVAEARIGHGVDQPAPGWFEHDAETVWWGGTAELCRRLVADLGGAGRVRALAVTTCGPCLVPVDAETRPLRAGILYGVDTRATDEIATMERRLGAAEIEARSGMPLTSQSVGPKIAWVARHEPSVAQRAVAWHTATSFIVARLTGVAAIDHHQASFFGPFVDARRRAWDRRPAEALGLDLAGRLPALRWPGEIAGTITDAAAVATHLPVGMPVVVGTSDGPTEALALGATTPGVVAIAHGTTTTLTAFARPADGAPGLWRTEGWAADQPCLGAGLSTTGALVDWLRRTLALDDVGGEATADRLDAEAATSPAGANGLLVVPSFGGERTPVADPRARGVIAGLSLAHGRHDVIRATFEGIAYGVRELLETFEAAGVPTDELRSAGGGTRSTLALQILSDVTGRAQALGAAPTGAATGAARLAAEAAALIATSDPTWFAPDRRLEPDPATREVYDARYRQFRQLVRQTRPIVHALADA